MKALKPVLVIVMMISIISTASPVYAAENIVFHMSYEVHNWRASLDFYDGADASDEEAPELIVDDADEATIDITVDEEPEQEPTDEAEEPELIIVDEEQEPTDELEEQQIGVPDAGLIVDEEEPAVEEYSDSEQISAVVIEEITSEPTSDPEIAEAQNAEEITIISTDNDTEPQETEQQGEQLNANTQ